MDLCFELASQIMNGIGDVAAVADEVHGFSFFDQRDLLGFVDGTENPDGQAALDATLVGDEDAAFAGGSYVIVQKYLHDLDAWNALPTEAQERIIGRTKLTNIELDAVVKPSFAHNELTKIVEGGEEIKIVRDNMPFGEVGKGDFGTYFIGYARSPRTIEQMLENMFIGKPPGQLRPHSRLQPRRHRQSVLRADRRLSRKCAGRRAGAAGARSPTTQSVSGRWFARHRLLEDLKRGRFYE